MIKVERSMCSARKWAWAFGFMKSRSRLMTRVGIRIVGSTARRSRRHTHLVIAAYDVLLSAPRSKRASHSQNRGSPTRLGAQNSIWDRGKRTYPELAMSAGKDVTG